MDFGVDNLLANSLQESLVKIVYMVDEVWHSTKKESDKHIFDK